ncbi:MAG: pyrimidine-nucleoside phosphorylase [Firmicutes bacterium]|nr:pyrimidine-nucleoside phosphorylase [Bacillota bacterium]
MRAYDLILKKREGGVYTQDEIRFLISGYTAGGIPDYQMAAWAMAVFFRGMNEEETTALTRAIVESGEQVDLSPIPGIKLDKHSTGGVGDTTTLVLAPLVAAAGGKMAKMSGRGLGHTGGTLDKFEAIPGFKVEIERERFIEIVNRVGAAVIGQSGNLAPADKKLYALRDVTATVDSIPLIASSVMSKKIAAGAEAIVLDVKAGDGAFVKTVEEAGRLARLLVKIGRGMGRQVVAIITGMEQPLGYAVGNALEVKEAVATLKGSGPADLTELCLVLGSELLLMSGLAGDRETGRKELESLVRSGAALERFKEMVQAQGGDPGALDDPDRLPRARRLVDVISPGAGFVQSLKAEQIGVASTILGAGREKKDSPVDPAVGIVLVKKIGDRVEKGEPLAVLHVNDEGRLQQAQGMVLDAYRVGNERVESPPLIHGKVID